jgi:hypothetical protein
MIRYKPVPLPPPMKIASCPSPNYSNPQPACQDVPSGYNF